ncbi:MAG: hypothetical protein BWX81_00593 [Spirochaetes bacterium ADurb.Bin110]|jgi:hypothetical protein|nr:MAG: hypothetical protein BWX81_00593 [Spirochaetes bacterium ADurb.Bin110]HNV35999.1 YjzC family protein [Rectinema sp.]
MGKTSGLKPGEKAPASGQYLTIGPKGGKGKEITAEKGKHLPPTNKPGSTYDFVDGTKNKSGKA